MPYHLATPLSAKKGGGRSRSSGPAAFKVGWVKGLEPSTPGTTIRCSNQLSYTHHMTDVPIHLKPAGTPGGTRTPGPLLRRQLLYPPELQAHMERVMGIEPTRPAWKAGILPLNYTRISRYPGIVSLVRIPQFIPLVNVFLRKIGLPATFFYVSCHRGFVGLFSMSWIEPAQVGMLSCEVLSCSFIFLSSWPTASWGSS